MFVLPSVSPGNRTVYVFVRVQFSDNLGNVISVCYTDIEGMRLDFSEKSKKEKKPIS